MRALKWFRAIAHLAPIRTHDAPFSHSLLDQSPGRSRDRLIGRAVSSTPHVEACAALSSTLAFVNDVSAFEWMSATAMGSVATLSNDKVVDVFSVPTQIKMRHRCARRGVAVMQHPFPRRDRAESQSPGDPMGQRFTRIPKPAIPFLVSRARPNEVIAPTLEADPESLGHRQTAAHVLCLLVSPLTLFEPLPVSLATEFDDLARTRRTRAISPIALRRPALSTCGTSKCRVAHGGSYSIANLRLLMCAEIASGRC
jgi:hypothetical protein